MNRICAFCRGYTGVQSLCLSCCQRFSEWVDLPCDKFFMQDYADFRHMIGSLAYSDREATVVWCCADGRHSIIFKGPADELKTIPWSDWRSLIKNYFPHIDRKDSLMFAGLLKPEHVIKPKGPDPNCPECRGTGKYVGFTKVEACSICYPKSTTGGMTT